MVSHSKINWYELHSNKNPQKKEKHYVHAECIIPTGRKRSLLLVKTARLLGLGWGSGWAGAGLGLGWPRQ